MTVVLTLWVQIAFRSIIILDSTCLLLWVR